jgi:hypothetical protein
VLDNDKWYVRVETTYLLSNRKDAESAYKLQMDLHEKLKLDKEQVKSK